MRNLLFLAVTILGFTISHAQNKLKLEVKVSNRPFTEYRVLDKDDIITLKLSGTTQRYEYSFDEVTIEIVTAKRNRGVTQQDRIEKGRKPVNLRNYINNYNLFSKQPTINIPFSLFDIECLSRIVLQVKKIKKKLGKDISKVEVDEFDFQNEISFFANWTCEK